MDFFNTPGQLKQLSNVTPGQQNIVGQAGTNALDLLKQIQGQQFNFDPIAQQARTQFHTQTVPSIAERFTSMGAGNRNSRNFQGALGSAASGLEQSLAALRSQYGLQERGQNIGLLGQLFNTGLTPTFQHYYQPGEEGWGTSILSALAQGIGGGISGGLPGLASQGFSGLMGLLGSGNKQQGATPVAQPSPYLGGGGGQGGFANPAISGNLARLANFGINPALNFGGY